MVVLWHRTAAASVEYQEIFSRAICNEFVEACRLQPRSGFFPQCFDLRRRHQTFISGVHQFPIFPFPLPNQDSTFFSVFDRSITKFSRKSSQALFDRIPLLLVLYLNSPCFIGREYLSPSLHRCDSTSSLSNRVYSIDRFGCEHQYNTKYGPCLYSVNYDLD